MTKTVTFCFDFGSPYSYLAYNYLSPIKDAGAQIELKPVLLGGIFKATGNQPPATVQKKGEYMFKDIQRWSKKLDISFKMNPYFPILTVPHMRGAILAQKKNILEDYMQSMFDSMWLKGLNLNDQEILTQVASESGIDPNEFAEGISSDEVKNELKVNTQFAIDKGAFGVPTYFLEDEMFWGIDSIKFLLDALKS
jgi:2-hydroxychromene-2-carboxylate isomerase